MAGIGKGAVTVDVVAAARQLVGVNPQVRAETGSTPVHEAGERGANSVPSATPCAATDVFAIPPEKCGLGHDNPPGCRFCASCGLPMDAPPPPGQVMAGRPKPVGMLTSDEKAERDKQHAEAVAANQRADELVPDISVQQDPSEQKLRIHFVEDGFTWGGKVWQLGEEIEIGPDHPRWPTALPWITLDKVGQVGRYGRVFFEPGPWPYHQLPPGTEIPLPDANPRRVFESRSAAPGRAGDDGALVPW